MTKDVCSHILISDGHMWRRSVDQSRVWLCVRLDVWLLSEQLSDVCLWPGRPFHLQPAHMYKTDTAVTGWDGTESAGWQEDCFHSKSLIKNLAFPQRLGEGECVSESVLVSHEEKCNVVFGIWVVLEGFVKSSPVRFEFHVKLPTQISACQRIWPT